MAHAKDAPLGAQAGAVGGHTALHAPHVAGFERSVSQPSAGSALQSAKPGSHVATTQTGPWHAAVAWPVTHGVHAGFPQP